MKMSDTTDANELEQLRQRKETLLLEQEVARLERKQALGKAGNWSWWWVGPLAAIGVFLILVGLDSPRDGAVPLVMGLLGQIPLALKFFMRR